jgi:hypothetical protein
LGTVLSQNVITTFQLVTPLLDLSGNQQYLQEFCSQSIGFLVRKSKSSQLEKNISYILKYYQKRVSEDKFNDNEGLTNGIAILLLESVKNLDHRLHSSGFPNIFRLLVKIGLKLETFPENFNSTNDLIMFALMTQFFKRLAYYVHKIENAKPVWELLHTLIADNFESQDLQALTWILGLCNQFLAHRQGFLLGEVGPHYKSVQLVTKGLFKPKADPKLSTALQLELFSYLIKIMSQSDPSSLYTKGRTILDTIIHTESANTIITFYRTLTHIEFTPLRTLGLNSLIKFMSSNWNSSPEEFTLLLHYLISSDLIKATNKSQVLPYLDEFGKIQFFSTLPQDYFKTILNKFTDIEKIENFVNLAYKFQNGDLVSIY